MPSLAVKSNWGKDLAGVCERKGWEKSLRRVVKEMDGEEFNLFLAQVVMEASARQIMGVDLTRRIEILRGLRG